MNEDTKRDRSPNFPKLPLEAAIELIKKLYNEIGKAKVKREVAISALGYSGASGSSLTTLGALNQYGLIDQDRGAGVSVSPMAISLLHPLNEMQTQQARITAALTPKVFNVLYTEGFHHASEPVLANNLIQNGFTPDGARKAASVYLANISFANLDNPSIRGASDAKKEQIKSSLESGKFTPHPVSKEILEQERGEENETQTGKNVLAQYSIPIGSCEATITFTGKKLSAEDFTALGEYVTLFKTQFERKLKGNEDADLELIVDVDKFETTDDGDYILPKFWDNELGYDYQNVRTHEKILSIGKRKSDGKILASTTFKFDPHNPDFENLWLR
jgi:hypothetical protein